MNFNELITSLAVELQKDVDAASGACGFEIDQVKVLLHNADPMIFIHTDLGLLMDEEDSPLLRHLLNANYLHQGTATGVLAINPQNNHLILQMYEWMEHLDAKSLMRCIADFVSTAKQWQSIVEDYCIKVLSDDE